MRARYRSRRAKKTGAAGKIEKYTFDNFSFFSRRVAKGSSCAGCEERQFDWRGEKLQQRRRVAAETGKSRRRTLHWCMMRTIQRAGFAGRET